MKITIIYTAIFLIMSSKANAQQVSNVNDELKVLYGADSTRVTPRIGLTKVLDNTPTNTETSYQNTGYSIPLKTQYTCQAYRGQYDIDSNAIGPFYIITENNPYLPNYKKIIMTDNSNCYQPCTPTNQKTYKSCSSIYGADWNGTITYNTYSSCSNGGYLQAQEPTYVSDNCTPPPPPPVTPPPVQEVPVTPPPVTTTPPPVSNPPVTPTPVKQCPAPYYSCQPWKPGFDKVYIIQFGPAPTCEKVSIYMGLQAPDDGMCGSEI